MAPHGLSANAVTHGARTDHAPIADGIGCVIGTPAVRAVTVRAVRAGTSRHDTRGPRRICT